MDTENLGEVLDEGYKAHQRTVAIANLGERLHLTLGQLAKLCEHPQHGENVSTISLQEIFDISTKKAAPLEIEDDEDEDDEEDEDEPKKAPKKRGPKKGAKKDKAAPASKGAGPNNKGDKGKPKPRLDYELGCKEVLSAVKAAKEPVSRGAIESATSYTGIQVRAFLKKLIDADKVKVVGDGGRSTKYEAA